TSAAVAIGARTTGPTCSTSSTSTPIPRTGNMMSVNMTAASSSWRRTGWSVTSAQSSGWPTMSKSPHFRRSSRFSGSDRPAWRMRGVVGIQLASHWLDGHGNAIVWDGPRASLPRPIAPGETAELELPLRGPFPPGRYRLAIDLVDEGRFWFGELGNARLETD